MAETIANNLEAFDGDIRDYNSHYKKLINHFDDLVNHMNALNSMWEGEAHDEFLRTFETDKDKTKNMIEDFGKVMEELRFAHREYSNCERDVANMINQMPV
ncbi:MAG: hypothetical protein K6F75_02495 [Butyrivibrio sp.]|nr:hypothetical protein [Butyrivibrio sp.]